jgi:hypothetical protein
LHCHSDPPRPVSVSFAGYVFLSAPSPRERSYRLRVLWADLTPWPSLASLLLFGRVGLPGPPSVCFRSSTFRVRPISVSGFPLLWLIIRISCVDARLPFCVQELPGSPKPVLSLAKDSCRFSPRIPRSLWTPADPPSTHLFLGALCVGFWPVIPKGYPSGNTIAVCFRNFRP